MAVSSFSDDLAIPPAAGAAARLEPLVVHYTHAPLETLLTDDRVLAVTGFGAAMPRTSGDARYRWVPLEPVQHPAPFEVWRGRAPTRAFSEGNLRWCDDGDYACGVLEIDEAAHGGLAATAQAAYRLLGRWIDATDARHVLRIWNYLDAINCGEGDAERYREFCRGRADGMRGIFDDGFPAATAIGVRDGARILRVYWIAARARGTPLENPRQISAWRYPRQYGPSAPTFARAMHAPTVSPQLYISGTAAIVGHASHHRDDFAGQMNETLANFSSLLDVAGFPAARRFGSGGMLKIYVRRDADAAQAAALLRERLPATTPLLLLHGDICRRELLVEIDGLQTG